MRTQLAGRRGWCGTGCRLVLALALCACGGGDDGGGETDEAAASGSADAPPAAAAPAPAAGDTCTGPPPAYAANLLTGRWNALVARLAADGITFPQTPENDLAGEMKLCPDCTEVAVRIRSSRHTPCLGTEHLTGEPRILSMYTVQGDFPAQHGWEALSPGDTVFVFATVADGDATLVYNSAGTARTSPPGAMKFRICPDGHNPGRRPRVRWRAGAGAGGNPAANEDCKPGCCNHSPGRPTCP
ncbi:MAG TPA: hypothetical protein VHG08_11540 [Longimicrobium sp.]|nr:hypothetical protein [Longimicrobium sp.]